MLKVYDRQILINPFPFLGNTALIYQIIAWDQPSLNSVRKGT